MSWIWMTALVGVLHVHHAPSHDSNARFDDVLRAAYRNGLDFLVLAEHVPAGAQGALPAAERAGYYERPDGGRLLVMVGGEFGTQDGHLLAYDVPETLALEGLSGHSAIALIHAAGGFAVVPHPTLHGGWKDWEAPFDGIEVHNGAEMFREARDLLFPLRLLWLAVHHDSVLASVLVRPRAQLELWDAQLARGRRVFAFSGSDAHQNVSILGWQLDPYERVFSYVRTLCPEGPLDAARIWRALREGSCWIRYTFYGERAHEVERLETPTGRVELTLDRGRRVYEIHQPELK